MKIRFLGTGAADWGDVTGRTDKDHRRLSSAVVDDILLIDPGPWVYEFADTFGYDLSTVKYVINTHPHGDHFNEKTLERLVEGGAEFVRCSAGDELTVGKYTLTVFPGNHGTADFCVHYIIDDGERKLFYGLDGAWLRYEEFCAIRGTHIDLGVFDGTIGDRDGDYRIFEHNNLHMVEEMKKTLQPYISRFFISHLARTLHLPHDETAARLAPSGIEVAYDGCEVEF